MIIGFDVEGQFVTRRDDERVVNRSVNYLELCFNFKDTETWDDLTKRVLFKGNGETYCKQLDNENKVVVPSEVLTGGFFVFSLYGITADLEVRVTCNLMKINMVDSGFIGDSLVPGPGNKSVVDDVYNRIDGVVVDVDALESTVSGHTTALSELSDDVTGLAGSVSALSSSVGAIGDDVDSLESTVGGHTETLTNLTQRVNGLTGDISVIGESVDGLESTVSSIGDDITAINGKLDNTIAMSVEFSDGTSATYNVVVK